MSPRMGPKTEAGMAKVIAGNLTYPPEVAAIKHGLRMAAGNLLACDRCAVRDSCPEHRPGERCQVEAAYLVDRRAELAKVAHLEPVDFPALDALLWTELRLQRAARALSVWGELQPGADKGYLELQPLAEQATKLLVTWAKQLQALSLTPAERRRLQEERGSPAAAIRAAFEALQQEQRAAQPVAEAEFTAAHENPAE